jgi:hypothetical protein
LTADYAAAIDESLLNLSGTATNSHRILNPSPCVQARLNGCGLQSKVKRHSTEYLGGIHQGICALLDRHHICILNDETSSTTIIPGALPLPSIETLLGNGLFDSRNPAPWSTLLSHEDFPLAIGLKAAWTDIQSHLNDTVINTPQLAIVKRPIEAAARIPAAPSLILSPQPFQNVLTFLHMNNYLNSTTL